jgi:hypothetical protein
MPVTSSIDLDNNLITYLVTGDMTLDDVRGAVDVAVADPQFRLGMNSLWNLKDARIAITMTELPEMIGHLANINDKRGRGFKVAILVRRNEDFGLSSLFEMNSYGLPFHVRVFRSSSEATEWLTQQSSPGTASPRLVRPR